MDNTVSNMLPGAQVYRARFSCNKFIWQHSSFIQFLCWHALNLFHFIYSLYFYSNHTPGPICRHEQPKCSKQKRSAFRWCQARNRSQGWCSFYALPDPFLQGQVRGPRLQPHLLRAVPDAHARVLRCPTRRDTVIHSREILVHFAKFGLWVSHQARMASRDNVR